jgi:hypothetical protein
MTSPVGLSLVCRRIVGSPARMGVCRGVCRQGVQGRAPDGLLSDLGQPARGKQRGVVSREAAPTHLVDWSDANRLLLLREPEATAGSGWSRSRLRRSCQAGRGSSTWPMSTDSDNGVGSFGPWKDAAGPAPTGLTHRLTDRRVLLGICRLVGTQVLLFHGLSDGVTS